MDFKVGDRVRVTFADCPRVGDEATVSAVNGTEVPSDERIEVLFLDEKVYDAPWTFGEGDLETV